MGLSGKYQKFYELKRWIIQPATKEINQFTDLKVNYTIHEKQGRTVTKIKFRMSPNAKNKSISPNEFLETVEQTQKEEVELIDPIFSNEIYQLLVANGIMLQKKVRDIVTKSEDEDYNAYVKDTVVRCQEYFKKNPSVQGKAGFILSAIEKDYFQDQRAVEQELEQKEAIAKAEEEMKAKVENLVKEGTKKFKEWRWPYIEKLRQEHLDDIIIRAVIEDNASNEAVYRKAMAAFEEGKPSKIVDSWVNDYLAKKYLEPELSNLDIYLEENY